MAKNIEMNILNKDGEYEVLYPNIKAGNIIDFSDNNFFINNTIRQNFDLDIGATPLAVFHTLSQYNLHWWRYRSVGSSYTEYLGNKHSGYDNRYQIVTEVSGSSSWAVDYSDSISINQTDGSISLVNPIKYIDTYYNFDKLSSLCTGKYFSFFPNSNSGHSISFFKGDSDFYTSSAKVSGTSTYNKYILNYYRVGVQYNTEIGEWQYVQSNDANLHGALETVDNIQYEYLGIPYQNSIVSTKFDWGTYAGDGGDTKTFTTSFIPKVLILMEPDENMFYFTCRESNKMVGLVGTASSINGVNCTASWDDYSVSIRNGTNVSGGRVGVNYRNSIYYYFLLG